jgi:GT2 family glycosyltransferase/glycosyltransferase involved in cell wall biosynthesis
VKRPSVRCCCEDVEGCSSIALGFVARKDDDVLPAGLSPGQQAKQRTVERIMDKRSLPNVIILTDGPVSPSHGTGAILMRTFANYNPEGLCNLYWRDDDLHGNSVYSKSLRVEVGRERASLAKRSLRRASKLSSAMGLRLANDGQPRFHPVPSIRPRIERMGFTPDIIYATCFSVHSMRILAKLISEYDGSLPVVQHFLDYMPQSYERPLVQELQALAPHIAQIWSLTHSIASQVSPVVKREVPVVNIFCDDIPPEYKRVHAPFGPEFTATILGNIWRPEILQDIFQAWAWVGDKLGGIRPIEWICHPRSVAQLNRAGVQLAPMLRHVGFLPRAEMYERLRAADIAIIPFNRELRPETDYARFSLPSRITEIAAAGLPIFLAASPHTETARYIEEHGIGVVALPANQEQFRSSLLAFIMDERMRAECGRRARMLAERDFDINKYQEFLYGKLSSLAQNVGSLGRASEESPGAETRSEVMDQRPSISVVMPTCNRSHYLDQSLTALLNQHYPETCYEIIVVDDASTDETQALLERWRQAQPDRLHVLRQDRNGGPAAARNRGVAEARGTLVAFTDDDCVVAPDWLEQIQRGLEDPRVTGVGGQVLPDTTDTAVQRYQARFSAIAQPHMRQGEVVLLITANALFRREAVLEIGGFPEQLTSAGGEELYLCHRLLDRGYAFRYNPEALVYHRYSSSWRTFANTYYRYGQGKAFQQLRYPDTQFHLSLLWHLALLVIPYRLYRHFRRGVRGSDLLSFTSLDGLRGFSSLLGIARGYHVYRNRDRKT